MNARGAGSLAEEPAPQSSVCRAYLQICPPFVLPQSAFLETGAVGLEQAVVAAAARTRRTRMTLRRMGLPRWGGFRGDRSRRS